MATAPKVHIDVDNHNLLTDSSRQSVKPSAAKGLALTEAVFPQFPTKLADLGPEIAPEKRDCAPPPNPARYLQAHGEAIRAIGGLVQ